MHKRLDGGCEAKVLAVKGDSVLIQASWPASLNDRKSFFVVDGIARNTLNVSRSYFERRYGVKL